jgi:hypothetical protein
VRGRVRTAVRIESKIKSKPGSWGVNAAIVLFLAQEHDFSNFSHAIMDISSALEEK